MSWRRRAGVARTTVPAIPGGLIIRTVRPGVARTRSPFQRGRKRTEIRAGKKTIRLGLDRDLRTHVSVAHGPGNVTLALAGCPLVAGAEVDVPGEVRLRRVRSARPVLARLDVGKRARIAGRHSIDGEQVAHLAVRAASAPAGFVRRDGKAPVGKAANRQASGPRPGLIPGHFPIRVKAGGPRPVRVTQPGDSLGAIVDELHSIVRAPVYQLCPAFGDKPKTEGWCHERRDPSVSSLHRALPSNVR